MGTLPTDRHAFTTDSIYTVTSLFESTHDSLSVFFPGTAVIASLVLTDPHDTHLDGTGVLPHIIVIDLTEHIVEWEF